MRRRELSCREQGLIDEAVTRICRTYRAPEGDLELRQTAWEAVLSEYRENPASFAGGGEAGWQRAYLRAGEAVRREMDCRARAAFQEFPLDKPLRPDDKTTAIQLLPDTGTDLEGGACLRDYLERLPEDIRLMAYGMMAGESVRQLQGRCRWKRAHTERVLKALRSAMREYME